jgi:pSer/pThr/pTyr-binding forkhead associated (FHA) protein
MCGAAIAATPSQKVGILCFPDGSELQIQPGTTRIYGRIELAKYLPSQTEASWISRKHFSITNDDTGFYIQDDSSLNKTVLNGEEITGKGRIPLQDGDQIEVAGIVKIRFATR